MKTRTYRGMKALGASTLLLVIIGGCPVAGVVIAGATILFVMGQAGVLDLSAGSGAFRSDAVVTLFEGLAEDRPSSGTLSVNVARARAIERGASAKSVNQAINGNVLVAVKLGAGSSTQPCNDGAPVGTFAFQITAGVVSCSNPSLPLPAAALDFAISGEFTICLEATSDVDVQLILDEFSVDFGPASTGNTNTNVNTNVNDNADNSNDNTGGGNDNTGNTNTNTNTNTNGNTNTNDNTGGNTNDNGTDPNEMFKTAVVVHRGSEAIIAGINTPANLGFVPPEKFNIGRLALSDDGKYVWFYLFWDSISPRPSDWIRLYRIDTYGLSAQRSTISEEAEAIGGGFLATTADGLSAVYEMQRAEPGGVFSRPESRFLRATPGGPALAFYDTENDLGLPSAAGPRMTDDGLAVYWYNIERLFRVGTSGGTAQELASVAHLNFYGPWDPFTGGQLFGLDINASGSEWLLGVRFVDPAVPGVVRFEVVQGAGALPQTLDGPSAPSGKQIAANTVQLNDDGTTIAYEESNAFGVGGAFVHTAGVTTDLRLVGTPAADGAYGQILADDAARSLVEVNFANQRTPVFQSLTNGTRTRAGSSRYTNAGGGVYARQLSGDGTVCVGLWNTNPIGTPVNNLYVLRDGVDGLAGHPLFGEISYRIDSTTDRLIVRCKVTSAGGLERIYLLPLTKGVEPLGIVPDAQNPLYHERWGGGVNFSTLFSPVEGQADTYERVIQLDGKSAFLEGAFTLRIIAVDSSGLRTSYRDIVPTR